MSPESGRCWPAQRPWGQRAPVAGVQGACGSLAQPLASPPSTCLDPEAAPPAQPWRAQGAAGRHGLGDHGTGPAPVAGAGCGGQLWALRGYLGARDKHPVRLQRERHGQHVPLWHLAGRALCGRHGRAAAAERHRWAAALRWPRPLLVVPAFAAGRAAPALALARPLLVSCVRVWGCCPSQAACCVHRMQAPCPPPPRPNPEASSGHHGGQLVVVKGPPCLAGRPQRQILLAHVRRSGPGSGLTRMATSWVAPRQPRRRGPTNTGGRSVLTLLGCAQTSPRTRSSTR